MCAIDAVQAIDSVGHDVRLFLFEPFDLRFLIEGLNSLLGFCRYPQRKPTHGGRHAAYHAAGRSIPAELAALMDADRF